MIFKADMKNYSLFINEALRYRVSCSVRTLKNGLRYSDQVVRTTPGDKPYMPMVFPSGRWKITGVLWQRDDSGKDVFNYNTYGPCKILTDAYQYVNVWELDSDGDYYRETDVKVLDSCYWLHYSMSSTTTGCVRLNSHDDAVHIGEVVDSSLTRGESCYLEVWW